MRITQPKTWWGNSRRLRRISVALSILLVSLLLRRALLVICLGLKILGHTDALNAWKGPVRHETVEHAGIPIDIYSGEHAHSPILIVHGINPTGKNSLDLMRISEALAQVGYQVFVPDLIEMRRQHLQPEEAGHIKSVFQFIGKDAAIACFSYGCGPAMIAAADPDIRDHVRFALAFGGYFDIRETLEFVVTGPESPIAYLKWVYLGANSDLVTDEGDRTRLRTIAEHGRGDDVVELNAAEKLSPEAKALLAVFLASTPEDFHARLDTAPPNLQRRLDALSPSRFVEQIRAPLILVHGINDPAIPVQQSIEFADAARVHGLEQSLTLLQMYGHVNPILPEIGLQNVFSFYLPETFRFLRVINHLVAVM
jgi:pimeloyl-ACP methyl ester carboxylesterase